MPAPDLIASVSRRLPSTLARHPLLLRLRLRTRLFHIAPHRIVGKPAPPGSWKEVRDEEVALYRTMERSPLVAGNWDRQPRPFLVSRVVDELFVKRLPREDTQTYQRMARAVEEGDLLRARNARCLADVHLYFDRVEALHESIVKEGFKSQQELGRGPADEVTICISNSGSLLLLRHGNHRVSIAQVTETPLIPVRVLGLHRNWVADKQNEYGDRNVVRSTERALAELLNST